MIFKSEFEKKIKDGVKKMIENMADVKWIPHDKKIANLLTRVYILQ